MFKQIKHNGLRDKIFTYNDWLLSIQQYSDVRYSDIRGRFYDSKNPQYGPPHCSSTGVYLEGLIDAFNLAVSVGDKRREKAYRRAIRRGIRSVMQLEFSDSTDLFYISKKSLARGGLRTTVYNNEIRIDNVQHNLMALLKILNSKEVWDKKAN